MKTKKHIDCNWLTEQKEGVYLCCDVRSSNHGRELSIEEVMQSACQLFHSDKEIQEKTEA